MYKKLILSFINLLLITGNAEALVNCAPDEIVGVNSGICIKKTGTCGANCNYIIDGQGRLEVSGNGPIKDHFFAENQDIISVQINDGITGIGWGAFYDMYHLEKISIPNSVVTIGAEVFQGTSPLTTIIIPESVNNEIIPEGIGSWKNNYWYAGNNKIRNVYCTGAQIESGICKNTSTKYERESDDYVVYNVDGTIGGIYANYDDILNHKLVKQHDKKDKTGKIIESYDGYGNLISSYTYQDDGSIYVYGKNGQLVSIRGKKIYTVEEAESVTARGDKFHVGLTYK